MAARHTNAKDTHVLQRCVPSPANARFSCQAENSAGVLGYYILYSTISIIRRPRLQQRERVRGGITSHYKQLGQEAIKQESKKQEARSGYRQQAARSKKLEARKQQAAGRQVRKLIFLSIQKVRQAAGRQLRELAFLLGSQSRGPQARSVPQSPASPAAVQFEVHLLFRGIAT